MPGVSLRVWPLVMMAMGLSACSSSDLFSKDNQFQSFKFFSKQDWSTVQATGDLDTPKPVGSEEMVDASGHCGPEVAAEPAQTPAQTQPHAQTSAPTSAGSPPAAGSGGGQILGGVALGMTECQVVRRAGEPSNVQFGNEAGADRKVTLTYLQGPWPGIYHFSAGRLKDLERVAAPAPAKPTRKTKRKPKTANR
jgi:hypothetical protein